MNQSGVQFTQISLFSILLVGRYGGIVSVAEFKKFGSMAIATMDRLDGEVQMIDGVVYQACADGRIRIPGDEETIPFGTVADFRPEQTLPLGAVSDYGEFEERMKEICPLENTPLAIHFTGRFPHMRVRAVRRQERDGVGLAEAAKEEALFDLHDTAGDLVGFRLPGYVMGVNAPGWHLHFMDAARGAGGHVVNFSILEGALRLCLATDYHIRLPDAPDVFAGLDLNRDRSRELKRAEAER